MATDLAIDMTVGDSHNLPPGFNLQRRVARLQTYLGKQGEHGGGPDNWVKKWTELMAEVYKLPDFVRKNVLVDILNEPDYMFIRCAMLPAEV